MRVNRVGETAIAGKEQRHLLFKRLLARLAHEIRNPLGSLGIHVQLLEEDLQNESPARFARLSNRFETIQTELHRLENVVQKCLDMAHPSDVTLALIDVSQVVDHVYRLMKPEAERKGIRLDCEVDERLPPIRADIDQLTQALVNLVINGIEACAPSEGKVWVAAGTTPEATGILLQVADNGPGIPPEHRATIFEPFFTSKDRGSGIGLWVVQQIMQAHGGEVSVLESAPRGTVFVLRLPCE